MKQISAEEFDRIFDEGKEDITQYFDMSKAVIINGAHQKINIDAPVWMVKSLDREAQRIGVTRQSILKMIIAEKLEAISHRNN